MNKKVHYIGLDVHKETIAVAIAPGDSTEVRNYGIIGGTLEALDKFIKKLAQPDLELRFVYEAGPCGYVIYRHLKKQRLALRGGRALVDSKESLRPGEDRPARCPATGPAVSGRRIDGDLRARRKG